MPGWRWLLTGLACCGGLSATTSLPSAAGDAPEAPAGRLATATANVAAGEAAAASEASALLGQLPLPAGATPSADEPMGDGGYLAAPELGALDTSDLADAHAWWIVPDTPAQVLAYVGERPPAGAALYNEWPISSEAAASGFALLRWPEGTGVLGERWLDVKVVLLAGGETGVRADAQVLWLSTPEPIPAGAKLLRVTVDNIARGGAHPVERDVTSAKRIRAITALLNRLPVARPTLLPFSCPADFGTVRLAFYASASSPPLATAVTPIGGCGGVSVTVHGRRQPERSSTRIDLVRRIERDLGIDLDAGPG